MWGLVVVAAALFDLAWNVFLSQSGGKYLKLVAAMSLPGLLLIPLGIFDVASNGEAVGRAGTSFFLGAVMRAVSIAMQAWAYNAAPGVTTAFSCRALSACVAVWAISTAVGSETAAAGPTANQALGLGLGLIGTCLVIFGACKTAPGKVAMVSNDETPASSTSPTGFDDELERVGKRLTTDKPLYESNPFGKVATLTQKIRDAKAAAQGESVGRAGAWATAAGLLWAGAIALDHRGMEEWAPMRYSAASIITTIAFGWIIAPLIDGDGWSSAFGDSSWMAILGQGICGCAAMMTAHAGMGSIPAWRCGAATIAAVFPAVYLARGLATDGRKQIGGWMALLGSAGSLILAASTDADPG